MWTRSRNSLFFAMLLCVGLVSGGLSSCKRKAASAVDLSSTADAQKNVIEYARGFTLEYRKGYKYIRVTAPWRNAASGFSYVLVPRGTRPPAVGPKDIVVYTPVRRIVVTSSTYVPSLAMLGLEQNLVGIANGSLIMTPSVADRIKKGQIAEIGDGSSSMMRNLNMERLLALQPEIVMLYGTGNPQYDFHEQLQAAGLTPAINAEYMETTPLGAAEWIKFVAAFFDKDAEAKQIFDGIAQRYKAERAIAQSVTTRPTVFTGVDYHGSWYEPGGNSYRARFMEDAGATYLWRDDHTQGAMPLTMEAVMARAKNADYWIDVTILHSMAELAAQDARYREFKAFREKRVFNNDVRINAAGGNDYWESGMANPDQMLADMISIFHPELMPDHKRIWYRQLPEAGAKQ